MVSSVDIQFAVGILGNFTSLFLLLAPLTTLNRICKKGSVEQHSPWLYHVAFFNCMIWILYGLPLVHPHSMLILTINAAGCLIEFVYLVVYVVYSDGRKRARVILVTLVEVIIVGIFTAFVLGWVHSMKERVKIVGFVGAVSSTATYAAPLFDMKLVIVTRSVEYKSLPVSLGTFANSVVWNIYGTRPFDIYIFAPNVLGALFGAFQLVLHAVYYKSTQRQIAERRLNTETDLAQVIAVGHEGDPGINNVDKTISLVASPDTQDGAGRACAGVEGGPQREAVY